MAAYEKAEKVEEGDWNWITPGFIAFASPVEAGWNPQTGVGGGRGRLTRSFRNVLEEFEEKGVRAVVRLNKKLYDRNHFLERGIEHIESEHTFIYLSFGFFWAKDDGEES